MSNEEKILEMLSAMQSDLTALKEDVSALKEDVAEIKEVQAQHTEILEEHTVALNELLAWADDAQVVVKIPFGQIKPIKQAE